MREEIKRTLEELLGEIEISKFAKTVIEKRVKLDKNSIRDVYKFFVEHGVSKSEIAKHAYLLCMDLYVERNWNYLSEKGVNAQDIGKKIELLSMHPNTLEEKWERYNGRGVDDATLKKNLDLLRRNIDGVNKRWDYYNKMGINDQVILRCLPLLWASIKTIQKKLRYYNKKGVDNKRILKCPRLLLRQIKKINRNWVYLNKIGVSTPTIIKNLEVLSIGPETIKRMLVYFNSIGINNFKSIVRYPRLFCLKIDNIEKKVDYYIKKGINPSRLAFYPQLLLLSLDNVERKWAYYNKKGIINSRIIDSLPLLLYAINEFDKRYQSLIGLLRQDYRDRNSGKELLLKNLRLFSTPLNVIEANIQYLHSIGIDKYCASLLLTNPQTKRKRLVWMLEELFDDNNEDNNVVKEKKEYVNNYSLYRLYQFIRKRPSYLGHSIEDLEKKKDRLKRKMQLYK